MLRTITVAIPDEAAAKLNTLAEREFRRPKDQAGLLLVEAIEARCKLLPAPVREPSGAHR